MKDKDYREKYFFNHFRDYYIPFSSRMFSKGESPDFVTNDNILPSIGVELTEIVTNRRYQKNSIVQLFSIAEQICDEACGIYTERYEVPLNVCIDFYETMTISKTDIVKLASQLADIVNLYVSHNIHEIYPFYIEDNLPEAVRDIHGSFVPGVSQPVWYNSYGGFMPNLKRTELENVIKKKERLIKDYRQKVDVVYLLIVEGIIPSWYDKVSEALSYEYQSSFDKIFLLRSSDKSCHQVKII